MSERSLAFVIASLLFVPVGALAQSGGGGGGGAAFSASGAASGPTAGTPVSPNAGSMGARSESINGVSSGSAHQGGINNSVNDSSGARNWARRAQHEQSRHRAIYWIV